MVWQAGGVLLAARMVWPGAMVVIASICTGWYVPSTLLSLAPPDPDVGSVSCGVWQMACRRVLKIGEGIIKDFVGKIRSAAEPFARAHLL